MVLSLEWTAKIHFHFLLQNIDHYFMELRILLSKFPDNIFRYFCENRWWRKNQYRPGQYWFCRLFSRILCLTSWRSLWWNKTESKFSPRPRANQFWILSTYFTTQIMSLDQMRDPIVVFHYGSMKIKTVT